MENGERPKAFSPVLPFSVSPIALHFYKYWLMKINIKTLLPSRTPHVASNNQSTMGRPLYRVSFVKITPSTMLKLGHSVDNTIDNDMVKKRLNNHLTSAQKLHIQVNGLSSSKLQPFLKHFVSDCFSNTISIAQQAFQIG